jgi:hypothetical protein
MTAFTVFCDDVRLEANGKHFLIGVYSGNILVEEIPGPVTVSTWVQVRGVPSGPRIVSLTVNFFGKDGVFEAGKTEFAINVLDSDLPVVLAANGLHFTVNTEGALTVLARIDGGEGIPAGEITITKNKAQ